MENAVSEEWFDSDQALIRRVRDGERDAFGELWLRHHRAAHWVAREFTSLEADDLVSQAYLAILETIQRGGGPTGPFRPYLYMVVRNLARRWGSRDREITVDEFTQLVDTEPSPDATARTIEHSLVAQAFSRLPERWQSVLWYTEVEGLKPREVAPMLGITENSVSALAYRAREGLRQQWVQTHVSTIHAEGECAWALGRLGEYLQEGLGKRDTRRMLTHLSGCEDCRGAGAEAKELSSQLAYSAIPLLLGGTVGAAWLAAFGPSAGVASAASLGTVGTGAGIGVATGGSAKLTAGSIAGATAAAGLPGAVATGVTVLGAAGLIAALIVPPLVAADGSGAPSDSVVGISAGSDEDGTAPAEQSSAGGRDPADPQVIGEDGPVTTFVQELPKTLINDSLRPIAEGGGSGLDDILNGVGDGASNIVGGVGNGLGGIVDGLGSGLGDILNGAGSGTIGGVVGGVGDGLGNIVDGVGDGLDDIVGGVGDGLGSVVDGVGSGVGDILNGLGNGLGGLFGKKK